MSQISLYLKNQNTLTTEQFYNNILINSGIIDISTNKQDKEIDIENIDITQSPTYGISNAMIEGVSKYMEASVQNLISAGVSNILQIIGINENTMNITKQAVNIMDNSITLVSSIISSVPSNIYMIPSGNSTMNVLTTSLRDMFDAMWIGLEEQYFTEINNYITDLPSLEEVQKDLIEQTIAEAENIINIYCYKYTGYHIQELVYMVRHYIALYKQFNNLKKQYAQDGINIDISTSITINPDIIKQQLLTELNDCTDLIYNAFIIIQIKDIITQISEIIKLFHDADLTTLSDTMNSFSDVMDFLTELGLEDDNSSYILSLEDTLQTNINNFQKNTQLLLGNIGAQMIQSGININNSIYNNINISNDILFTQLYEFKADPENGNIIMYIYSDPTTSQFKKLLNNTLSEKTESGVQYMSNADILLMFNKLEECFNNKNIDNKITIKNITYIFKFDIKDDIYQNIQNNISNNTSTNNMNPDISFSLGLVTEEYTSDPIAKRKRPTLQIIHELFAILKKFFPILQIIIVLISNYKINKEKVKNHAQGNLYGFAKLLANAKGLTKKINVNNKNFYTVRTLKCYNYINENIININNSNQININTEQTELIYIWLKTNNYNHESINTQLETLLYIDTESIIKQRKQLQDEIDNLNKYLDDSSLFVKYPDTKYKDGDILGLDKIEYIGDEIYYSDSSLPIYGSQILIAYGYS